MYLFLFFRYFAGVNLNNLEIKRIKDQFGDMSKLDMHITELTAKASEVKGKISIFFFTFS